MMMGLPLTDITHAQELKNPKLKKPKIPTFETSLTVEFYFCIIYVTFAKQDKY